MIPTLLKQIYNNQYTTRQSLKSKFNKNLWNQQLKITKTLMYLVRDIKRLNLKTQIKGFTP